MIATRRATFNREFRPERYAALARELAHRSGGTIDFHLSETPCFFPASVMDALIDASQSMVADLLGNADYRRAADEVVPPAFRLPAGETLPTFVQVDFGFVTGRDGVEGRLVELQAFPSLYGFQLLLAETVMDVYGLEGLTPFLGGLDRTAYFALMRRALVGDHDPAGVVLLEIDPEHQKTRPDFAITEAWWGVRAVDVRDVVRVGRRLLYRRDGALMPIARIYNRVIPDELERRRLVLPFDFRDDLDVEWTGGPDWFFRLSKFSIPWLRHPWVPETHYLGDVRPPPADRENWLLKPLFSFAGGGIVFAPTDAELAAIPAGERAHYVLQRRVPFTPVVDTPFGPTQAEVRIMLVRDGDLYRPVLPLVRMGRGRMMGVDYNKGLQWVGAAAGLVDMAA